VTSPPSCRLVALLVLLACWTACTRPRAEQPIDVVLIVLDTVRAQNLPLYGYDRQTAPNLERFARDAVTYDVAITPGTWTVPAHGALFTGVLPSFHGAERVPGARILTTPVNPQLRTLAEILRDAGWRTGAFIGNATYVTGILGFARGFDVFADRLPDNRAPGVVGAAIDWFAASQQQAFLFINILDPHEPYEPPAPFDTRFPGRNDHDGSYLTNRVFAGEAVTPAMRTHFLSQYDGEIAYSDEALEALFARLRELDRYESSLIVVTSDHGEHFGEHGIAGHGNGVYEPLLRVPLLVKYPANRGAGTRVERRVSTLGVFATILDAASLARPPGTQAIPLDQPHPVWLEEIDFGGNRVIVGYDGPWKLVQRRKPDATQTLLYDLASDPDELRPVQDATAAPVLRERLLTFAALPRPNNEAPPPVIEPERERQLRALGYIH